MTTPALLVYFSHANVCILLPVTKNGVIGRCVNSIMCPTLMEGFMVKTVSNLKTKK